MNTEIPLLGMYLKNTNSNRHMHPMFLAALFTTAKIWKQPKCPSTYERINFALNADFISDRNFCVTNSLYETRMLEKW